MALQPIGQGVFGRTFLAIDLAHPLKIQCVIKQFFPQDQGTAHSSKASSLFQEEAMRLQELGQHSQRSPRRYQDLDSADRLTLRLI